MTRVDVERLLVQSDRETSKMKIHWLLTAPLRIFLTWLRQIRSEARKLGIQALYPGVRFEGRTFIDVGVRITSVRGARVRISNCHIARNVTVTAGREATISIAADYIGPGSTIVAQKRIAIGPGTKLAEMVVVRDADHDHSVPLSRMRFNTDSITIGEDVWLAAGCAILKGTTIGNSSTVGAGAVVRGHFPERSTIVGVPGKNKSHEPTLPHGPTS